MDRKYIRKGTNFSEGFTQSAATSSTIGTESLHIRVICKCCKQCINYYFGKQTATNFRDFLLLLIVRKK